MTDYQRLADSFRLGGDVRAAMTITDLARLVELAAVHRNYLLGDSVFNEIMDRSSASDMKHSFIGLTPKQALLVGAISRQMERVHGGEILRAAAREAGLSHAEMLLELDIIVQKTDEATR